MGGWQSFLETVLNRLTNHYQTQGGDANNVEPDWVGLRLGKIADWRQQFLGPMAELPDMIRGFWQQLMV